VIVEPDKESAVTRFMMVLDDDDLVSIDALARVHGSEPADLAAIKKLAVVAMRQGLATALRAEGLPWAPSSDVVGERLLVPKPREAPTAAPVDPPAPLAGLARVSADRRVKITGLSALGAGGAIALIGGYVARWGWTGFASNNQLWDWMNLLLLPVALGTLPLWLRFSAHMSHRRRLTFAALLAAFGVFVLIGYLVPLGWTGFTGNTLWDWLTLVVLPVAVISVRAWPASRREIRTAHVVGFVAIATGLIVTLIGGYAASWQWTGYPGNTLWDWMQLLLAPIVINSVLIPKAVRWASGGVERLAELEQPDEAEAADPATPLSEPPLAPSVLGGGGSAAG
jgi:hypothetical protein